MSRVFISHSSKDALFQNRLVEILNSHGIATWSSAHDLEGGDDYKREIDSELMKADILVTIISKNAKNSNWVTREITTFLHSNKPERRILPIRLDDTNPDKLYDGLGDYHIIDFTQDHIAGYKQLLLIFDKEFSYIESPQERRSGERRKNQRLGDDRRKHERRKVIDRRATEKNAQARRLRVGFLNTYLKETRNSEYHEVDLLQPMEMLRLINKITGEAKNYSFIDHNQIEVDSIEALEKSTAKVWEELREFKSNMKIAYIIDAIVGEMLNSYTIEMGDRRNADRRKGERREKERRNKDIE